MCTERVEHTKMGAVAGDGHPFAVDEQGRVHSTPGGEPPTPDLLARGFEVLVCARLRVISGRTVDTPTGHLGIMTLREHSGAALELWAGAALREDACTALCDAAADAVLTPWHHSAIVAGSARLIAEGTCRAAMVIDDSGVTTYGPATEFPPLSARGVPPKAGVRLAARTTRGEFRALSLGGASVAVNVLPGTHHEVRVDDWFDALEAALL